MRKTQSLSFHLKYQAFQVFSLGMVNVYRVIGRLAELMEQSHSSACIGRGCKDGFPEVLLAYYLGTGKSKD